MNWLPDFVHTGGFKILGVALLYVLFVVSAPAAVKQVRKVL